jgi:hypothetical protein
MEATMLRFWPSSRPAPLTDRVAVVELIGATTTATGLKVECLLDNRTYEKGIEVRDAEMQALDITGDAFHPDAKTRRRKMRRTTMALFAAVTLLATSAIAQSLRESDLYGKWCDAMGSYTFAPNELVMYRSADGATRRVEIVRYEIGAFYIPVRWIGSDGIQRATLFAKFNAEKSRMTQPETRDGGPPYEFRRC